MAGQGEGEVRPLHGIEPWFSFGVFAFPTPLMLITREDREHD